MPARRSRFLTAIPTPPVTVDAAHWADYFTRVLPKLKPELRWQAVNAYYDLVAAEARALVSGERDCEFEMQRELAPRPRPITTAEAMRHLESQLEKLDMLRRAMAAVKE